VDAIERRRRASKEAAEWWVRLQGLEELPRTEREEYVDWLRESPIHVAEMLRVAQLHNALDQFNRWTQLSARGLEEPDNVVALKDYADSDASDDSSLDEPRGHGPSRHRLPSNKWRFVAAAGFAALVAGWLFLAERTKTIETERGERREVALSDGSVLDVDPETRLRVKFDNRTRHVYLDKGRALFHVAKNPNRPFLVEADGTTVRAVGTEFGVEHQDLGVVVTVSEGKVAVTSGAPDRGSPITPGYVAPSPHEVSAVILTAGEQVTVSPSGSAKPVKAVDSERELSWAKGRLVFENESLAAAVAEFNRYNRVQMRILDPVLAQRPVSAVFDANDPESFVAFIQSVAPVRVTRGDSTDITISPP
jgi:transmembrane sensor